MKHENPMKNKICIMALLCVSTHMNLTAEIALPSVFTDGMMLQQQADVRIWGKASPNKDVSLTTSWDGKKYKTKSDKDGYWKTSVTTPKASKESYSITVSDGQPATIEDVLIGEIWMCSGQSNMDMRMEGRYSDPVIGAIEAVVTSSNPNIRMFTVGAKMTNEPMYDCTGNWQQASPSTLPTFSAAAYYFARKLNEALDIPIGILHASYGGSRVEAWMSNEAAAPYKEIPEVQNSSILYNGMLHPLVGYGIRGCLWYQGEANIDYPDLYTRLFPDLVNSWREEWEEGTFPFLYAQIAPFNYNKGEGKGKNSAYLREAQTKSLALIDSVGMISLMDIGDPHTIHPMEKKTVGDRFAYLALQKVYGMNGFEAVAPCYKSMEITGDKAIISFHNADQGLTSYRKPLLGFEIAGEDRIFHPANAWFGKDMKVVEVASPEVKAPVAVRYGFKDYFEGCLFNNWGIPAPSFRTDEW